jgi:hypothetical protein
MNEVVSLVELYIRGCGGPKGQDHPNIFPRNNSLHPVSSVRLASEGASTPEVGTAGVSAAQDLSGY